MLLHYAQLDWVITLAACKETQSKTLQDKCRNMGQVLCLFQFKNNLLNLFVLFFHFLNI